LPFIDDMSCIQSASSCWPAQHCSKSSMQVTASSLTTA
jgi:hypothetical protein